MRDARGVKNYFEIFHSANITVMCGRWDLRGSQGSIEPEGKWMDDKLTSPALANHHTNIMAAQTFTNKCKPWTTFWRTRLRSFENHPVLSKEIPWNEKILNAEHIKVISSISEYQQVYFKTLSIRLKAEIVGAIKVLERFTFEPRWLLKIKNLMNSYQT